MTLLSFVTRTIRLPIDGTCSGQVVVGGMLLVMCSTRMMRMPPGGGVPAWAAFKATDTPLYTLVESPVAVIAGLTAEDDVCTEYCDACGNPWRVFHAMSASSR